ncbi:hypothetical protein M413DRAFT_439059 [Hebeloma cylindrosporum]|uniref:F-box domain-containing protein n=1 Tax=Hebeloma cylindrosporum TaxID=76867 RepID=A0A0C3CTE8_HEBCY|nr:hypothetical protein M413DRAFT_439059 [Hebeloma cylindrosporum h7]
MTAPKVLRPESCTILDGNPCAACTEDIECEKEIKELQKQIQELESRIAKLHLRRRPLRTAMNENHDRLIHRFPSEIASHIFLQCSPPSTIFDGYKMINTLYLGSVCQKWRQLAWATPDLWTSLNIGPPMERNEGLLQLIAEWLERSASLPLTITLEDRSGRFDKVDEVIELLNKHSARWHDMRLDIPAHLLERLSGSSQENMLRRLFIRDPKSGRSQLSTFTMKTKPRLTDLALAIAGISYVDIVWNNLTVASVGSMGVDNCLELIRRAPLLKILKLGAINPSSNVFPVPGPNARIVHPCIHSLDVLGIWQEAVAVEFFDSLRLPSLERFIQDLSHLSMDSLASIISDLPHCLKALKIGAETENVDQLPRLLSNLPSLEILGFWEPPPTDEFFTQLCASAQSPQYLPRLRSLEFNTEFPFPWESLPKIFTVTRWKSLKVTVDTQFDYLVDRKIAKQLLELVDEGYDLSVINKWDGIDLLHQARISYGD